MQPAPIALFAFKRLNHTRQTIESLKKNFLALESELFIFADGPRNDSEKKETDEVRDYLRTVIGFRKISMKFQESNLGLAKSIIAGVSQVINEFGEVIVVEDDLVTSPYFLTFMNDALNKYRNDERVGCINGYVYPLKVEMQEPFFLRGADCWGWATWKRAWSIFEHDGQKLLQRLLDRKLDKTFDFDNTYPYVQMLRDQINGKNNSWAIRWLASSYLADKLCLYPNRSLVKNIGFDGSGTHCGAEDDSQNSGVATFVYNQRISLENVAVSHSVEGFLAFKDHFKIHFPKRTLLRRILGRIHRSMTLFVRQEDPSLNRH